MAVSDVLIYARDDRNAKNWTRARLSLQAVAASECALTNTEVLNERTRLIRISELGRPFPEVQAGIEQLGAWGACPIDQNDAEPAWLVRRPFGYQWFDGRLVAAAQRIAYRDFLTDDMAHGAAFDGVTLINPFRALPDDLIQRN